MRNTRSFVMLAILLLMAQFAIGQVVIERVSGHEYARINGRWHTVVDGTPRTLVDTNHLLVRLKNRGDIERFNFSSVGIKPLGNERGRLADGFYELTIPWGTDGFDAARRLEGSGTFDEVFFNVFLKVQATPNDAQYANQWNLPKAIVPNSWDITKGDPSVIVAVIDVGGDYNHEDLAANKWSETGYDFYNNDADPYPTDGAGHGTCVAGILGAVTNNSLGVSGIAGGWNGVGGIRIMHLRAGYRYWDPNLGQWLELIDVAAASQATSYAASNGARVINMSFGGPDPLPSLQAAIDGAVTNQGVVVVASAGNYESGQGTAVMYPAAYANVIAVGATTESDCRKSLNDGTDEYWWGSSYGPQLAVMAPGIHVRTTDITGSAGYSSGNYFTTFNGTSAAAPHVTALAALIRSVNPSLTVQQVRDLITNNADKVPGMGGQNFTNEYGFGRINALKSLGNAYVMMHPDYQFAYSDIPSLSYVDSPNMNFLVDPNWCNSAGVYSTDRYHYLIQVNRTFALTPLAWYLGPIGDSYANPNTGTSWLGQTINTSTIQFETVFYKLKSGNLSCENGYAPYDPTVGIRPRSYAYLGKPCSMSVSISGPSVGPCATGTWTASVSCGTPAYTYHWYQKFVCGGGVSASQSGGIQPNRPCDSWVAVGTNSPTLQYYWCGGNGYLRVDVTDARGSFATAQYYVRGAGGAWTQMVGGEPEGASMLVPPTIHRLEQNSPNPFNPTCIIRYQLPATEYVTLKIYDVLGREVADLVNDLQGAGYKYVTFDASRLNSGIYFYRLQTGSFSDVKKMALMK